MHGTSSRPRSSAARTRPWPAIMSLSALISTGFVKPNSRIEAAICLTLLGRVGAGIVRVRHKVGRAAEHHAGRHLHDREIPFL
jgi:hypothetical protein